MAHQKGEKLAVEKEKLNPKTMTLQMLMTEGKKVYGTHCAVCHQANGKGLPPPFPAIAGSQIATGPLEPHIDIVLNGKAGSAMQAFKDQLNVKELAAVLTYQRHAWGNDKINPKNQKIVQPKDIVDAMSKNELKKDTAVPAKTKR